VALSKATPGRPRRFEAAEEIELIFKAAFEVMRRNDYQEVTVADILAEAGMSTRSFYRHFGSKDELLCAMYRRDAERAAERLTSRVERAASPREALEAWVDEILSFGFNRARARRAAVLGSPGAMRAEGSSDEARHAGGLLTAPLLSILDRGRQDGTFPLADPKSDARMITAFTLDAAGLSAAGVRQTQAEARRAVLSFTLRALGGA
jgi:AcrR family transcriptional regulator